MIIFVIRFLRVVDRLESRCMIQKHVGFLQNKIVRVGLLALSACAIYAFGKRVGEVIYYFSH